MQVEQRIPFDDIVPGAEVRVAVIDGVQYLSIRDVIMCVCVTRMETLQELYGET